MAQIGLECTLWRGAAGSTATTLVTNVKDANLKVSTGEADVTTRAAQGWKVFKSTLKEGEVTFQMIYSTGDADALAFAGAFFAGTPLAIYCGMGDGVGLDCDATITQFDFGQNLEEGVTVDVALKPTRLTRAPAFVLDGSGPDGGASGTSSTGTTGTSSTGTTGTSNP